MQQRKRDRLQKQHKRELLAAGKNQKNRGVGGGDRKQESCSNLTTKVEFTPISPTPIRATRACGKRKGTRLRVHLDYKERSVVCTLPQSCNADNEVRWSRIRVLVERKLSDARQVSKHRSLKSDVSIYCFCL